jgi:hypothetical protein
MKKIAKVWKKMKKEKTRVKLMRSKNCLYHCSAMVRLNKKVL